MKRKELKHIEDILWYDHELIAIYVHPETGELYLRYWFDIVKDDVTTFDLWLNKAEVQDSPTRDVWLVTPITAENTQKLMYGSLSILDALSANGGVLSIDFDVDDEVSNQANDLGQVMHDHLAAESLLPRRQVSASTCEEISINDLPVEQLPDSNAYISVKEIQVGTLMDTFTFTVPTCENVMEYKFEVETKRSDKVVYTDKTAYQLASEDDYIHLNILTGMISEIGLKAEGDPEKCQMTVFSGDLDSSLVIIKRYVQERLGAVRSELVARMDKIDAIESAVG